MEIRQHVVSKPNITFWLCDIPQKLACSKGCPVVGGFKLCWPERRYHRMAVWAENKVEATLFTAASIR
jgi:hypothetical protein